MYLLHVIAAMLLAALHPYLGLAYVAVAYVVLRLSRIEQQQRAIAETLQDLKVEVTIRLPEEDLQRHFPRDIKPYLDETSNN